MNKHTKMALFVAPFLMIGGFIASDFWIENQAAEKRVFALKPKGACELVSKQCVLSSGDLEINVYHQEGKTWVNSTWALDSAMLFLVDANGKASPYPLAMGDNPYYWWQQTPLAQYLLSPGDSYTLRIIASIKGGRYVGEFTINKV